MTEVNFYRNVQISDWKKKKPIASFRQHKSLKFRRKLLLLVIRKVKEC